MHFDDGDFTYPREMEGSQAITINPVTRGLSVTRRYLIDVNHYTPSTPHIGSLRDARFPLAVLTSESTSGVSNGLLEFTRTFTEIPADRYETEQLTFTFPGRSRVNLSAKSGLPIYWDKYGQAAPYTRTVNARVEYKYSLSDLEATMPTMITYGGLPVDYCGYVYISVGQVDLPGGATEERYVKDGQTDPFIAPTEFIHSVGVSRYEGPIFEHRIVRLSSLG